MNGVRKALYLTALAVLAAACELRPLYIEGVSPVSVLVCMDWTQLGGDPSGATINFYPEDGSKPYTFQTNSVKRTLVSVPSGYYTVLIFNRSVIEYGSMSFKDMDMLGTAQCVLETKLFSWLGYSDTIGRTVYEPEEIVVGRTNHFQVRSIDNRTFKKRTKADTSFEFEGDVDSVMVRMERMVMTGTVKVRVKGLQNVSGVRAYLTNMAGGDYLATRMPTDTLATHVFENWSITRDAADYTLGYLTTTFKSFGLPEQYLTDPMPWNNKFILSLKLVDNKTVLNYSFYVGDQIKEIRSELILDLVIGVGTEGPIVVPDVEPAGGSASGFDVTIDDWGEDQDVYIPL